MGWNLGGLKGKMFLRELSDYKAGCVPCQAETEKALSDGRSVPASGLPSSSFSSPGPGPSSGGPGPSFPSSAESDVPPAEGGRGGRQGGPGGSKRTWFPSAPGGEGGVFSSGPGPGPSGSARAADERPRHQAPPGPSGRSSSLPPSPALPGPLPCGPSSGPGPGPGPSSGVFYLDCIAELPSRGEFEKAVVFPVPGVRIWKTGSKGQILPEKVGDLAREWEADHQKRLARAEERRRVEYRESGLDEDEAEKAEADRELTLSDKKNRLNVCGSRVTPGACEEGHGHARSCICNRQSCSICRERAHNRRKAEWYKRAFKLSSLGELVLTLPLDKRPETAAGLSQVTWIFTEVFKRWGFDRGSVFFHPFGTAPDDGSAPLFHPHWNVMFEGVYIQPEALESIKKELGEELGLGRLAELNYRYYEGVTAKCHWIKYVTRATFLDRSWSPALAEELYGFRYSSTWGVWEDPGFSHVYPDPPPTTKKAESLLFARWARADMRARAMREAGRFDDKWGLPEKEEEERTYSEKILAGVCPVCNKKITWARPVSRFDLGDPKRCPGRWEEIYPGVWQRNGPPELARNFAYLHPRARALDRASPDACEAVL